MASRETKTQKQAQQLKTLEDRLTILSGELADAEAECKRLQAERDDFANKAERVESDTAHWSGICNHLTEKNSALTDQLESSKTNNFAAWIVAAIGWICFLLAAIL